ncbi:MAG: F0F1 ATP synthase subunit A [Planctomycetota bacterium]|jgi:F-type H+-transporting ATPase subunit a
MVMLASIVSHLSDYTIPGLGGVTAHHVLIAMVSILMITILTMVARLAQSQPKSTGFIALIEVGLVWVRDEIVYPWLGPETGRKWLYFFWTLFFFILANNLIGLMPAPINPWHRAATGNIMVTFALAFMAFCAIQFAGMKKHGWVGYWTHLVPHGLPKWLVPIVWVIEFVGLFTKPFALMVRLFANMTAGHAIIAVLGTFLFGYGAYRGIGVEVAGTVSSFAFMLFMMLFETLVALIQAYIFTVLTAIFMSVAVAEEH